MKSPPTLNELRYRINQLYNEGLVENLAPNSVSSWCVFEPIEQGHVGGALVLALAPGDGYDLVGYYAFVIDWTFEEDGNDDRRPVQPPDARRLSDVEIRALLKRSHDSVQKVFPGRDSDRYRYAGFMVVPDVQTLAAEVPLRNFLTTCIHQLRHHLNTPLR